MAEALGPSDSIPFARRLLWLHTGVAAALMNLSFGAEYFVSFTVPPEAVISYPPVMLESFFVYGYEWIDNLHFTLPPERFVSNASEYVSVVQRRFLEAGWDGNGEIDLTWAPPTARER